MGRNMTQKKNSVHLPRSFQATSPHSLLSQAFSTQICPCQAAIGTPIFSGQTTWTKGHKSHPLNAKKMARNSRFEDNLYMYTYLHGLLIFLPRFCWFQASQVNAIYRYKTEPFFKKGIRSLWRIKTVKFKSALFSLKLAFIQIQGLFAQKVGIKGVWKSGCMPRPVNYPNKFLPHMMIFHKTRFPFLSYPLGFLVVWGRCNLTRTN